IVISPSLTNDASLCVKRTIIGHPSPTAPPVQSVPVSSPAENSIGTFEEYSPGAHTPDDLGHEVRHDMGDATGKDRPGISTVREQLAQEGELSEQGGEQ